MIVQFLEDPAPRGPLNSAGIVIGEQNFQAGTRIGHPQPWVGYGAGSYVAAIACVVPEREGALPSLDRVREFYQALSAWAIAGSRPALALQEARPSQPPASQLAMPPGKGSSMSAYRLRVLTQSQVDQFHTDGSVSLPDVYSPQEMDAALEAAERLHYGMPFEQWKREVVAKGQGKDVTDYGGQGTPQNRGPAQFPTGEAALDRLLEKPILLDMVADVAGTDDLHYLNGHIFLRSGPTDTRFPANPWEGFHFDHNSGSVLPPGQPGTFDYLGCGILLNDVDEGCAPTVQIPGSHRMLGSLLPRLAKEGLFVPPSTFTDVRKVPEFARRTTWTGKRGTLGLGSSYGVHAAAPFRDKTKQRVWWTMAFNRGKDLAYNRCTTATAGAERQSLMPFLERTSPRVRALFGWPLPGHPYYTPATLELLALQYPKLDLGPYRQAAQAQVAARAS